MNWKVKVGYEKLGEKEKENNDGVWKLL